MRFAKMITFIWIGNQFLIQQRNQRSSSRLPRRRLILFSYVNVWWMLFEKHFYRKVLKTLYLHTSNWSTRRRLRISFCWAHCQEERNSSLWFQNNYSHSLQRVVGQNDSSGLEGMIKKFPKGAKPLHRRFSKWGEARVDGRW